MKHPVHFDPDEVVAGTRDMAQRIYAAAMQASENDRERLLVQMQHDLLPARVEMTRWFVRHLNAGTDPTLVVQALGAVMATQMFDVAGNYDGERPLGRIGDFQMAIGAMLGDLLNGASAGLASETQWFDGVQGGNA